MPTIRRYVVGVGLSFVALALAGTAVAEVTRFEVLSVEQKALEGASFGNVGTYDRIKARVTVAVDPADPHNKVIADIELAPKNAAGKVEATSEVEILRPSDPKRGNGKLFFEVTNRGNKQSPGVFDDSNSKAMLTAADAGNGYLLRQGYTLVWSGWQGDVKSAPGTLALTVPTLTGITSATTAEIVFDNTTSPAVAPLAWPAADEASAKLVVRAKWDDQPAAPADLSFRFVDPTHIEIKRPAGFDAGALYSLDYVARDPKLLGIGFAATRDLVSFLRRDVSADNPLADHGRSPFKHVYGYGQSLSGRFLREFLYLGYNEDLTRKMVFDGVLVHVSGARFTATNLRFGLPERAPRHPLDPGSSADRFPFTYEQTINPFTHSSDGVLKRCTQSHSCPKIIEADSEYEWYNSKASLLVTDPAGKPVKVPANVRLYTMSGTPHIAQPDAVAKRNPLCVLPVNPLHQGPLMRAMLDNLDKWVDRGTAPPPSRTPNLADGTLVEVAASLPKSPIPGLPYTGMHVAAAEEDSTVHPAKLVGEFKLYLPKLNDDGMIVGGVHMPVIDAPKATYTGWNPRVEGDGPTTLCPITGGAVAFAATSEDRQKANDPRPSVRERYPSPGSYVSKVDEIARTLVRQHLMLEEDLPRQHKAAEEDTLARLPSGGAATPAKEPAP